jgi:hypothetical protein
MIEPLGAGRIRHPPVREGQGAVTYVVLALSGSTTYD